MLRDKRWADVLLTFKRGRVNPGGCRAGLGCPHQGSRGRCAFGKVGFESQRRPWTGQGQGRDLEAWSPYPQAQGGLERVHSGKDGHAGLFPLPLLVMPDSAPWTSAATFFPQKQTSRQGFV